MADIERPFRSLLGRTSVEREVDGELAFHLEMRARELVAQGMDEARAQAEARRRFGDLEKVRKECRMLGRERERDVRRTEYLAEAWQDVRFALRQLARSPGFTLVAILTLALGIGPTTAIFSAVEAVALRGFDYAHPERTVLVMERWQGRDGGGVSAGNYTDWRARSTGFEQLAAVHWDSFNLSEGSAPERVEGARVTWNYFAVFGARPALGRTFDAAEDEPGKDDVVVLGHGLWTRRFGADPSLVGRRIRLSGRPHTVIGVMRPLFDPVLAGEQLWVPAAFTPERKAMHDEHYLVGVGLLAAGRSMGDVQREMDGIAEGLAREYPKDDAERGVGIRLLSDAIIGDSRQKLLMILGGVFLVVLIACGNVANLLLARGALRAKEIAIRAAIGAGRARLVRQLLTESAVLGLVSAVAGVGLAWIAIRVLVSMSPADIPRLDQTRIDAGALVFALATSLASSLLFGMAPAWRAARADLQGILRDGGRTSMAIVRDRVRTFLIVGEVALALTLLAGAGLFIRSAYYLQRVDPGFDPHGLVTARLSLPPRAYKEGAEETARAFEQVADRLRGRPGIRSVGLTSQAPMGPGGNSNGLVPEGRTPEPRNIINARLRMVDPGYFATLGVPLQRGRLLTADDRAGAPRVMVVSEALARAAWPGQDPIGKRIGCCEGAPDDPRLKTVVGVVGDVRSRGAMQDVQPEFYLPLAQLPAEAWDWNRRTMTIMVRAEGVDPTAVTPALREAVREVDPELPLYGIQTMEELMRGTLAVARFHTTLLVAIGGIGLLLAAVGIYGVIAYFATSRTHEIGVRMAMGATARDIVRLVAWQGMRPILVGTAVGVLAAAGLTRLVRGSVYGVSTTDPATFTVVALTLVGVGLVAASIPALRSTRTDPTEALR
jgi:putative ABC transport system permease protein